MADYERLGEAMEGFFETIKERLSLPYNRRHHLLASQNGRFTPQPLVKEAGLAETQSEVDNLKGQAEDFGVVFNSWQRISRFATSSINPDTGEPWNQTGYDYSDEAIPSELEAWVYDSATNTLRCTENTASMVGFIAPYVYDEYVIEVQLSADQRDDDFIGLCLGYVTGEDGHTHTLTVHRALNGPAPMRVIKDWSVDDYIVQDVYSGLTWQDGTVAVEGETLGGTNDQGWDLIPTGIRLKASRVGDVITIETSQPGSTSIYDPATTVIDLSADPELEMFRGLQQFGYVCRSQARSTWEIIQRPDMRKGVVDLRDYTVWTYEDGTWVSSPSSLVDLITQDVLASNWLHFSPTLGRYYYLDDQLNLTRV